MLSEWQDHERGERGPHPLSTVSVGEDGEPVEVQEAAERYNSFVR